MGLAASTRRVPTMEPTIFIFSELLKVTPLANPVEIANCEVSSAVRRTPPLRTKLCSLARPSQPSPGRMSGVESFLPTRLGVSGVFIHGRGLLHAVGVPWTIALEAALPVTGGKRITSYLALRSGILAIACVLM